MTPVAVIFYVVMIMASPDLEFFDGKPEEIKPPEPIYFQHRVNSWAECLYEAHEFAAKPSNELKIRGGRLQVGCMTEFPPSQEH